MEGKTQFNPSNFVFMMQLLKDFLSPMKKKQFSTTGIKRNVSKNNYNLQGIYPHILSMMVHLLLLVLLITDILLQEPLRMQFADMLFKLVIMFLEDSVGIVTDFQSNMKLIRNLKSLIKDKFQKWVSQNTIKHVETLS